MKKTRWWQTDAGFVLSDLELVYYVKLVCLGIDLEKLNILKALNFANESSDQENNAGFGISDLELVENDTHII